MEQWVKDEVTSRNLTFGMECTNV